MLLIIELALIAVACYLLYRGGAWIVMRVLGYRRSHAEWEVETAVDADFAYVNVVRPGQRFGVGHVRSSEENFEGKLFELQAIARDRARALND